MLAVCADVLKQNCRTDPDKVSCAASWEDQRSAKTGTLPVKALSQAKLLGGHQLKVPGSEPKLSSCPSTLRGSSWVTRSRGCHGTDCSHLD